jgi:hypothetical protein
MDWWAVDVPPAYYEINVDATRAGAAVPTEWVAPWLAVVILAVAAGLVLSRRRRRSFWCPLAEREVVVDFRWGHPRTCTAFEDPRAIACARRCTDSAFRNQWPPALPVVMEPSRGRQAA